MSVAFFTSLTISLIKYGREDWRFLGDDYIILSKDGTVYSYPRPFAIYAYHIPLLSEYFSRARLKALRLKLAYLLRSKLPIFKRTIVSLLSNIGVTKRLWLEVNEILPETKIAEKAPLFRVYMLSKTTSPLMEIKRETKENAVHQMFNVLLYDLITPYSDVFSVLSNLGFSDLFMILRKHREIINSALSDVDVFHVSIPSKLNFIELVELIERHVKESSI